MADDPTPQDPPKDPDPAPSDPPAADPPKDPEPPADPPKDPEPVDPSEDVVTTRAENESLKARVAELEREKEEREKERRKAPAPPKRTDVKPKADPKAEPVEVKGSRRRRVSRFLGDHYDDDE